MNGLDRLLQLRAENDAAGEIMRKEAPRFLQLARRHELGTAPQSVTGFNLFQTPRVIAARMADLIRERIGDRTGARILEPSVGLGRLWEPFSGEADAMRQAWQMVEDSGECVRAFEKMLKRAGIVRHRDFLDTTADDLGGRFDAVIMNPPFKQGRDVKHIEHALEMVRPGGRLVALCYNGTRQNEKLRPIADVWEVLPEKSFREEGTAASVAMLMIDK